MISNFLKRFVSSKTNERPASSSSSSQSLINELPNDILEEIFFHLSGKELCQKTLLVCKKCPVTAFDMSILRSIYAY